MKPAQKNGRYFPILDFFYLTMYLTPPSGKLVRHCWKRGLGNIMGPVHCLVIYTLWFVWVGGAEIRIIASIQPPFRPSWALSPALVIYRNRTRFSIKLDTRMKVKTVFLCNVSIPLNYVKSEKTDKGYVTPQYGVSMMSPFTTFCNFKHKLRRIETYLTYFTQGGCGALSPVAQ